jgi:bifunctional UDP-N-acetylglucosamine pyrophosphorylase/glucosamine-1-phosphate N-acetyltransferase
MKAVILAAGESSRFKPLSDKRHKALTYVLGKPVIEHTIDGLRNTGVEEIIVVQGEDRVIEAELEDAADQYVVQEEPRGMGNALLQAREFLGDNFLVLTPYRSRASELYKPLIDKAEKNDSEALLVCSETDYPEDYGIIDFKDGKAVDIVEKPDKGEAPSERKVVGMYLLDPVFFEYLDEAEEWEYQFEDALSNLLEEDPAPLVNVEEEPGSIKYPWDIFQVARELMEKKERKISSKAEIADSAELKGKVMIEEGAKIHENAVVKGPAYIGRDTVVGNNAVIRDNSFLEEGSTVGANCEVKNTVFQPSSSMHSQFIGDSVIGRNTKIGAGTVVANRRFRDGDERPEIETTLIEKDRVEETERDYLGCFTGENVDIGVNCSIMPGVQIGSDSKIGPGTVVTENVESGQKIYADQEVKLSGDEN